MDRILELFGEGATRNVRSECGPEIRTNSGGELREHSL